MSEMPDRNENFESTYESSFLTDNYDRENDFNSPDVIKFTMDKNKNGTYDFYKEVVRSESLSNDTIDFSMSNNNGFWKYNEDKTMKEIREYIGSTYRGHYTSQESRTQTLDLIESIGDAEAFCRSNAIKYLSRFGKKNGKSKLDILKVIHYCILLYHFSGLHDDNNEKYETF